VAAFKAAGTADGFPDSRVIATDGKSVMITNPDSTNPASKFGFYADTQPPATATLLSGPHPIFTADGHFFSAGTRPAVAYLAG
jgi:hypothetical protein